MTNIYWPVYRNLEDEMEKLFYSIHIDDSQLNVHSSKIADLILRAAVEIESISKKIYKNETSDNNQISFDDSLKFIKKIWFLEKKTVIISSSYCFQSVKTILPFIKNEKKNSNNKMTYSWNNAYQNLKHDRANSLQFGSLKYLFDIMAALFILNVIYKDEKFDLKRNTDTTNFPTNLGSKIYSIKLHLWKGYDGEFNYFKNNDFDECLYWVKLTDISQQEGIEATKEMNEKQRELLIQHPKFQEYINNNKIEDYKGNNLMWDVLGKDDYINTIRIAGKKQFEVLRSSEYEAVVNKNSI